MKKTIYKKALKAAVNEFGAKIPKKEEEAIRTSFIPGESIIYEQTSCNQFIDSAGEWHTEVFVDGIKHIPNIGEELTRGIVLLPDYPEDYENIQILIENITQHIHKYYDCEEQHEKFAAWYVLLSWVFDRLNTINYLRALGDWGTGKSRFGDVVGRICYKPIIGSGAGSVAALKRMVNKWRGTVISDEGDFKADDEKSELVKFYNLGFEKNRAIYQCDKNDPNKIEFYVPFCPKIVMTRRDFSDKALESRCLTHISRVTKRNDIPIHLPSCFYQEEKVLRNKLLKFRLDFYFTIDSDKVLNLNLGNIEPRLKQAMGSYAVLFANIPEMYNSFVNYLSKYQAVLIEDRASSFDGIIINKAVELILKGFELINSQLLASELEQEGIKTNSRVIGKHLAGLGLETKQKKIEGKVQRFLEFDAKFLDVVQRYVSDSDMVARVACVASVALSPQKKESQAKFSNKEKIHDHDTHATYATLATEKRPKEVIFLHCHYCNLSESCCYDSKGHPVCVLCRDNPELNIRVV